ncbi:MAG: amino acid ABC transporter ATP-binding protein [Clostridia bacterium]|nr:amino acid ABC transporter ATP-binding protein [Clostridia bacterium]
MLDIRNVKKRFEDQVVLDGISLEVEKGDVVAILGPSGSGKTTFLRCLNFLERADEGEMVFEGIRYDLNKARKEEVTTLRRKTAFVFQNYNLFLNKTVLQNVTLGLILGSKIPKQDAREIAVQALQRVGMADRLDSYPSQLSGGQQQRVAIARGLALRPEIIFFDEPTSALDPELIGEVLGVMRQLAEDGMTMLVVTHEMEFARNVSSKVLFMENGHIVESGPSREFFENPKSDRSREFVNSFAGFTEAHPAPRLLYPDSSGHEKAMGNYGNSFRRN